MVEELDTPTQVAKLPQLNWEEEFFDPAQRVWYDIVDVDNVLEDRYGRFLKSDTRALLLDISVPAKEEIIEEKGLKSIKIIEHEQRLNLVLEKLKGPEKGYFIMVLEPAVSENAVSSGVTEAYQVSPASSKPEHGIFFQGFLRFPDKREVKEGRYGMIFTLQPEIAHAAAPTHPVHMHQPVSPYTEKQVELANTYLPKLPEMLAGATLLREIS